MTLIAWSLALGLELLETSKHLSENVTNEYKVVIDLRYCVCLQF